VVKDIWTLLNREATRLPGRTAIVMLDYACDSETGGDALVNAIVNQNVRYRQAVR